jgi:glycopeptide antibiotics resistance protein
MPLKNKMVNPEKNRIIPLILTILLAVEIFYFSTLSFGGSGAGFSFVPVAYHFIVFFLFSFFLLMFVKGSKKIELKHALIALLFSILYAISDEIHQRFVPLRSSSIQDVMIDSFGIFLAVGSYWMIDKKIQDIKKHPRKIK